ncbi:hypothetical protein [Clostridium sp. JN-9]|uniref:hypothetical protein n=1 Tax=Clostridium sp. JN-9 TaxID=2507159 RepID=UPI000FFDFD0B|nr:hypothetical protein [Clostridium sp. JN-9]QAT40867.1 hypothetical protein EQM05_11660 [Clostridium sp. JN-9]
MMEAKMMKAENVKGFENLTVNAEMFKQFLNNFYAGWGTEARATIEPISVKFCKNKEGKYLRFDYKIYGKKQWLHVTGPHTWY